MDRKVSHQLGGVKLAALSVQDTLVLRGRPPSPGQRFGNVLVLLPAQLRHLQSPGTYSRVR